MSESLVFMMGEFEATFPTDRQYAKNHCGPSHCQPQSEQCDSALPLTQWRLLQDVYFLDWAIDRACQLERAARDWRH